MGKIIGTRDDATFTISQLMKLHPCQIVHSQL